MKPYETSSKTSDTQTYRGTFGTVVPYIGPISPDNDAQLDVAIIHQMVVDALRAVAASVAGTPAGRQLSAQHLVP
jgi:hypothetical protein